MTEKRDAHVTMLPEDLERELPAHLLLNLFSFVYDGRTSRSIMPSWKLEQSRGEPGSGSIRSSTTWTDPDTGLRVTMESLRFTDYPAVEWVLYFENTGRRTTPVVENIQAMDVLLESPMGTDSPYILHTTNGAPSDPTDFQPSTVAVDQHNPAVMGAGGGRSSNKDFPFFKVDTGSGSLIVAVGWSGQWKAELSSPDGRRLRATAGMETTHFVLHPGEKVRSPRILAMYLSGDSLEANAQFRQLIHAHYVPSRGGRAPLPVPFCNTCFTRCGVWLNECNADNQISLIRAYGRLGLEAMITDAGWFTGGWPDGAGNWDPRKDAYPDGIGPVAAAAKEEGMSYGLWFEPERVIHGTAIHRQHPEWCLSSQDGAEHTYLLNFGLPDVQDYFFGIVSEFMALPGFRVYRQDFNMDPLPYWRFNDAADRQGITEIRYIEGLYAYWDRIRETWPDVLMEECASGGRRIDLETIMRLDIAQKSDYWFDDDTDQASLWGLSQYLPNNVFVAHLNNLTDYSFHSTMASSLCLGWIADAPDFDLERGRQLLDTYMRVGHLLVAAWYPLMPYTQSKSDWMAVQYHRPDLDEGIVLAFRRAESAQTSVEVALRGLDLQADYELSVEGGTHERVSGASLMQSYTLTLPTPHSSALITYRRAP